MTLRLRSLAAARWPTGYTVSRFGDSRREDVRVVSLLDITDHARRLQRHFPRAVVGSDLAGALTHSSDLALVLTPHSTAANAGRLQNTAIMCCARMMAMTDADCQVMTSAQGGRQSAIGMIRRFSGLRA
jgi:hypothetical protein